MFDVFGHHDHDDDHRLAKLSAGAASPLWLPFLFAASVGVGYWMLTQWTRRSVVAQPSGFGVIDAEPWTGGTEHSRASPPNADPDLDASRLNRPEQSMAHNPLPAEAPTAAPDTAPEPPVPAEHVMDHTPADTVNAAANPEVERRIAQAGAVSGEEPGGRAALLAETSAAVLGETASFGGDLRAEDEAGSTSALDATDEDAADLLDAAYAANLGPVIAPGGGKKSKKRKNPPGTAPEA
jgi:hypothetical protein